MGIVVRIAFFQAASAIKKTAHAALLMAVVTGCSTSQVVTATAAAPANEKYAAIVVDANTGKTLFSSSADAQRYPASLTKMMTLYMLFEAMKSGRVNRNTPIPVSAYAASRPPTKIGFKPGQSIPAEAAILALITKSANDVAAAVGEYLGGSEERFAQMMTTKAKRLGMRSTVFRNASGLPNMQQHSTARDMAILGMALRQHFPNEYAYFSKRSFTYRGQTINGHNRLLGRVEGVDGIKTGYTNASGFNLVSSVNVDGKQMVAVVMGGRSAASRDKHMQELIAKYLPQASRGRGNNALIAARADGAVNVAAVSLPTAKEAPLPVMRQDGGIEQVINGEFGEGDREQEQPQVLALAAPMARPAAKAIENVIVPTPRAEVPSVANNAANNNIDPVTTASAASAGGWAVQIGSLPSEDQARTMLAKANASVGGLKSASPYTETFQMNGTMFYRARFVGFASKQAAWNACAALKKQKFGCYAIAN
ncbi:D-alanyl-D-alanine carboxypeptidase [Paenochrobactrum glaciei]|uniref:D-alanyl-D-alanine carboxypeptidase n=1 Tax=Paenochrobactrum glaciei TaxID=486407 RepID=A0ABN1FGF6_9HYPH